MHDPDFDRETRRLISLAAERFGGPESDVGDLPYGEPGLDPVFDSMRVHLRRSLDGSFADFMGEVLDEAGTMFATLGGDDGREWHVEARLFAMVLSGPQAAVHACARQEGLARIGVAMGATGLAPRSTKVGFMPTPLPLSVVGDLSPGRLRGLTHCLAARTVQGFPPAATTDPRVALGMTEGAFQAHQNSVRPGSVTRALVGVRCARARSDKRMPRDWFSGFDPSDAPAGAQDAWEGRMAGGEGGADVGMPMSWMEAAGLLSSDHVVGTLGEEARRTGLGPDLGQGSIHHFEDEAAATLSIALAMPGGRVLGPAHAPRDAMLGGYGLLTSILGCTGEDAYRHASAESLAKLVMRGAVPMTTDADDADGFPRPGRPAPGDGMPAIH